MSQEYNASVTKIISAGDDKVIVRLKPSAPFLFSAGQYLGAIMGDFEERFYSIANAPGENELEIHIKDNGKGGAGSYAKQHLSVDENVKLYGPYGTCSWTNEIGRPLVLIAGGMGIVPHKSIIEAVIDSGAFIYDVQLYWGTDSKEDMYLSDVMETYDDIYSFFKFVPVIGKKVGDVAVDAIENTSEYEIYLAGPPAMIKRTKKLLLKKGVKLNHIHFDDGYTSYNN